MKFFWQKKQEAPPPIQLQEGQSFVSDDLCKAFAVVHGRRVSSRQPLERIVISEAEVFPLASEIIQQIRDDEIKKQKAIALDLDRTKTGTTMSDGSIYLGYYGGKDWFVTAEDAKNPDGQRALLNFYSALEYAKNLKAHNHDDWMLPPSANTQEPNILDIMAWKKHSRDFDGTYDPSPATAWYWSGTENSHTYAWQEYFSRANKAEMLKSTEARVRCVRAVKRLQDDYYPGV